MCRGAGVGCRLVCAAAVREGDGRSFSCRDEQCPPRNALLSRRALALDPESTVNRFVRVCFKQEKSKV